MSIIKLLNRFHLPANLKTGSSVTGFGLYSDAGIFSTPLL